MPSIQLSTIDDVLERGTATGAVLSIPTEQTYIADGGLSFLVRWAASQSAQHADKVTAGRRDPGCNPFLPPAPELVVAPVGDAHLAVLNKYPIVARHVLLVTRSFEEQTAPLTNADFDALAHLMAALGGLGFYNGGEEAGASQRHKHLQWIPDSPQSDCLQRMTDGLPTSLAPMQTIAHPALPWRHCFVRLDNGARASAGGGMLAEAFAHACESCGLRPAAGAMPPYNLLVNDGWMVVVPRSREHFENISINALGFAGSMFVRKPALLERIRSVGPLQLLASVAYR